MRWVIRSSLMAAFVATSFGGCASDASMRDESDTDAIRAHDRKVCTDYGFRIGAEDFAHCIEALRDQRAHSAR